MAKLYFYYSAMNAGKSTTLLQSNHNYHERGMGTILYTPKLDNRFLMGKIHSRIGVHADAIPFAEDANLFKLTQEILLAATQKIACVFIDEAHFLSPEQVHQISDVVDYLHLPVLTYGLRTDFQGKLFPGSQYLLGLADEMIEIKTICHCGKKAIMNVRVDAQGKAVTSGDQVLIGDSNYLSTCRKHFKEMQKEAMDALSPSEALESALDD